ncbi:MAG: iron-containing alcohol dehydrogenase [Planctomycetota bacterium]|jgi:glycerol-1-phosphate dehydrogenase [NAD(P)+]
MNPKELLDTTFDCECGRSHNVPIRKLIYAEDALERLPEVLGSLVDGRCVVVIGDRRTWDIAGRHAQEFLKQSHWSVRYIVVPDTDRGSPVCDETTHDWLNVRLPPADIALAVGCGVINDLTKWSAFDRDMPYVVMATAATMNGFTAANVAPAIKGVKTLIRARPPLAVLAVPSVIVGAPFELTAAGLGDVIAKPISAADWLLNHVFYGEHFCRYCSEIINGLEPYYLDRPGDVKNRKPAAIDALFKALLYSGIAMTIMGSSAPASGGEHLLSHTLDMVSSVDGVPHDLHGRQVGLGTLFASALYDRILRIESPDCSPVLADIDGTFWGPLAPSVRQQYEPKKSMLETMPEKLTDGQTWPTFLTACRCQVRSPEQIKNCLQAAGAAHTFADIGCSRERLLAAVLHMHEIRTRPTIIDLAWILGILPGAADQIIDCWLTT